MSDNIKIEAAVRENVGTGAARATRRTGAIPGIVYGLNEAPAPISIDELALNRLTQHGGFYSQLYDLELGGKTITVQPRDLQVHPVTDRAMHVDFLRVSADAMLTIEVPMVFLNEDACKGLNEGGILNVVRYTVEVICRPNDIPEQLEVDLTPFELGDSVHISAVTMPAGVTAAIDDRDFTVATIASPAKSLEQEDAEAADGAEEEGAEAAAEGEEEEAKND